MGKEQSNKTLKQKNRLTELKTNQDFNGQQPTVEQIHVQVKDTTTSTNIKRSKKRNKVLYNSDKHFDDDAQE
ncbi:MAG TPA: hypothetical protein PLJ00_17010 [Chitinophagales bacterium]|nr:hypothetical protein [Chitinophagales bacterium]